jgi:DeoR family fructose operon transcriptional repressor
MISDAPARQRFILSQLEARGTVRNSELRETLGTTAMTIWRDLKALEERGLVRRLHGRVTLTEKGLNEPHFHSKTDRARQAKEAIAACAASVFVEAGDTLAVDGGTTVAALASQKLPQRLSILTNSLHNAEAFLRHPSKPSVYLCGGLLRERSGTFIGREALSFFSKRRSKTYFLSATGIDAEAGVTDLTFEDNEVKRAMAAGSERVALLADASKFGNLAPMQVFPLGRIDHLVTDAEGLPLESIRARLTRGQIHSVDLEPSNAGPAEPLC